MIEGNAEPVNLQEGEIVAENLNPNQDAAPNVQIHEGQEEVQEDPVQAPAVEENIFLKVLGIHLIAQQIYNFLDMRSLKNCLGIHRSLHKEARVAIAWRRHMWFINFENEEDRMPLKECLTSLEIQPRSRYTFTNNGAPFADHLNNQDLQDFFNRLGIKIRELRLEFPESASSWHYRTHLSLTENEVMGLIKRLVAVQAVRMQILALNVFCLVSWKEFHSTIARPLRKQDQEYDYIHSEAIASAKNYCLRKLEILGNISSKVVELIISLAPNLQEIAVPESAYEYLLDPVNRLYLLKAVTVCRGNVDSMERLLALNTGNFKLRELTFQLWESGSRDPEIENRLVSILNSIFTTSWKTLEFLDFNGVARLPQINWPISFPKVSELKLGNPLEGRGLNSPIFPENFEFGRVFSALKKFTMYHHAPFPNKIHFFTFLNFLNLQPVSTVNIVDVWSWEALQAIRDSLRAFFPNVETIIFRP